MSDLQLLSIWFSCFSHLSETHLTVESKCVQLLQLSCHMMYKHVLSSCCPIALPNQDYKLMTHRLQIVLPTNSIPEKMVLKGRYSTKNICTALAAVTAAPFPVPHADALRRIANGSIAMANKSGDREVPHSNVNFQVFPLTETLARGQVYNKRTQDINTGPKPILRITDHKKLHSKLSKAFATSSDRTALSPTLSGTICKFREMGL